MKKNEVKLNYDYFSKNRELFLEEGKKNKFALMHEKKIITWFLTFEDAYNAGIKKYKKEGMFSIQQLNDEIVNLGFFSCV